jgi:hypothetical protein
MLDQSLFTGLLPMLIIRCTQKLLAEVGIATSTLSHPEAISNLEQNNPLDE